MSAYVPHWQRDYVLVARDRVARDRVARDRVARDRVARETVYPGREQRKTGTVPPLKKVPQQPRCERCGEVARTEQVHIRNANGETTVLDTWSECETPWCFNENGSQAVQQPDRPGELTRDDKSWLARHRRLIAEWFAMEHKVLAFLCKEQFLKEEPWVTTVNRW